MTTARLGLMPYALD